MGLPPYPLTRPEMLLVGAAILAATVVLFSLIFGLFGADGAFATAAGTLAIMVTWDVAVERPNRQDRLAEAYAASMHSIEDTPPGARAGATDWAGGLPGPLGAVARNAPATLAALLIVGVALGINGLLAEFTTSDRDDGIYVFMRSGAIAEIKGEGDSSRSLRVTLLTILERPERTNPSLTANPYRKYWAAEVMVENTGAEDISAPAWKLRACGKKYDPVSTRALGEDLGDGFTLSRGEARTGWVVFEIHIFAEPEWLRARLSDHPAVHFASRELCIERR